LLSNYAGHPLDLGKLAPEAMLAAMIASFEGQEQELTAVIKVLTSLLPRE
jgi:cell filamentation protein, protein adenylyltransferase